MGARVAPNNPGNGGRSKRAQASEEERELAAIKIQATARGRRERRVVQAKRARIDERQQAATRIQASARGRRSRNQVRAHKKEVTTAATKVQRSMRCLLYTSPSPRDRG